MKKLPTDRQILRLIYKSYEHLYPGEKSSSGRGTNDPYLPIDVAALAQQLDCNPELLFGRLYYHLDQKYRYKQDNGAIVPFFYLKLEDRPHVIHFPHLTAILAGLEDDYRRQKWALRISFVALVVAIASATANFLMK